MDDPPAPPGTPVTSTPSRLASPPRELERDLSTPADPGAEPLPPVAIIGRGRLGTALARAALGAGVPGRLAGRDEAMAASLEARAALLCVPDGAISDAAARLVAAVPPLELVGHTSGATGLDALAAAERAGASLFSLHPLQTVPGLRRDERGGWSPSAAALGRSGSARAAGRDGKGVHAAASLASNFLVALQESAADLLAATGVSEPRRLLAPLVQRTAANWAERGGEALTGPIVRGDEETVERHLGALRESAPELVELYEALAERTRELAGRRDGGAAGTRGRTAPTRDGIGRSGGPQ